VGRDPKSIYLSKFAARGGPGGGPLSLSRARVRVVCTVYLVERASLYTHSCFIQK